MVQHEVYVQQYSFTSDVHLYPTLYSSSSSPAPLYASGSFKWKIDFSLTKVDFLSSLHEKHHPSNTQLHANNSPPPRSTNRLHLRCDALPKQTRWISTTFLNNKILANRQENLSAIPLPALIPFASIKHYVTRQLAVASGRICSPFMNCAVLTATLWQIKGSTFQNCCRASFFVFFLPYQSKKSKQKRNKKGKTFQENNCIVCRHNSIFVYFRGTKKWQEAQIFTFLKVCSS